MLSYGIPAYRLPRELVQEEISVFTQQGVKIETNTRVEKPAELLKEYDTVEFPVVAVFGEEGTKIGAPYVEGATVTGKVVKNGKAKKITVFTYKPKKNSKRKMGHRQPYTKVQIEAVKA